MSNIFNDTIEQKSVSLEEMMELPALFERVVKKQMSSNLAEMLIAEVDEDLHEIQLSIAQFQQLAGGIYEGVVERLQLQETQLIERKQSLEGVIEAAKMLSAAMGHLAVAKANLDLLDEISAIEPVARMGSFDIPVATSQKTQKTVSVELKLPEPMFIKEEIIEVEPAVEFIPLFKPAPPPRGIRLKPAHQVK